jgi:hypothetical protein
MLHDALVLTPLIALALFCVLWASKEFPHA